MLEKVQHVTGIFHLLLYPYYSSIEDFPEWL